MRIKGIVKWFNNDRGYGFINRLDDPDKDYFVHFSYIQMDGYKKLKAKEAVSFKPVSVKGKPHAMEVGVNN